MATGDLAVTAGLIKYAATQDKRLGYDNDNQRGDDIAAARAICVLRKTANQTLATGGSGAVVTWDLDLADRFAMHDPVTNNSRITIPISGSWQFSVNLPINSTSGIATAWIRVNGSSDQAGSEWRAPGAATILTPLGFVYTLDISAGSYIEVMVTESVASGSILGSTARFAAQFTAKFIGLA